MVPIRVPYRDKLPVVPDPEAACRSRIRVSLDEQRLPLIGKGRGTCTAKDQQYLQEECQIQVEQEQKDDSCCHRLYQTYIVKR
jgi:hypothetical protein